MWWIIGTLIGMASNLRKESPEQRAKRREDKVSQGCGCLFLLVLGIFLAFMAMILGMLE